MVEQYTGNQYDDDLTLGTDEYDDSYYTDADDLFAFSAAEESPISRLKSLILSIDWEITDEILLQFNEELVDLKDIWAGEKINLVYVQALEKISKYIYHKKADSHPNAIKLLLTLYHNLEKIVSTPELTDEERSEILIEDVRRFEGLKKVIGKRVEKKRVAPQADQQKGLNAAKEELLNLKAVVLGIDWEITDKDLEDLRQEVVYLEHRYAHSKPRLILLQGIGTLGAYIKLKKSDAHGDAFKVLHFFYDSLEKMVATPMSLEQEKEILFPAVKEFNAFKALLGRSVEPDEVARSRREQEEISRSESGAIAPALSEVADEETVGFQAEEEAREIGMENVDNVDRHVEGFFNEQVWRDDTGPDEEIERVLSADRELAEDVKDVMAGAGAVAPEIALQGVDVEEDDEEGEGIPGPALSKSPLLDEPAPALAETAPPVEEPESPPGDLFVPGVDVESDADDDSDEEPLPVTEGDLAPALAMAEDDSEFEEEEDLFAAPQGGQQSEEEIYSRVEGFFDDPDAPAASHWKDQEEALEWADGTAKAKDFEAPSLEPEEVPPGVFADEAVAVVEETSEIEENIEAFFADTFEEELAGQSGEAEELFAGGDILAGDEETELLAVAEEQTAEAAQEAAEFTPEPEAAAEEKVYPVFVAPSYTVPAFKLAVPKARPAESRPAPIEKSAPDISGNLETFFTETAGEAPYVDEEEEVIFELVEDDGIGDAPGLWPDSAEEVRFDRVTGEEDGLLSGLAVGTEALGREIDNRDSEGMKAALSEVRGLAADMPLQQTYVELLGAVLGEVQRREVEPGDASFAVLTSLCEALQASGKDDLQTTQKRLLRETTRVLALLQEKLDNR